MPPDTGDNGAIPSDEEEDLQGKEVTLDVPLEVAGEVEVIYEESNSLSNELSEGEGLVKPKGKKVPVKNASKKRKKTLSSTNNHEDIEVAGNWSKTSLNIKLSLQDFHPFEKVSHLEGKSPSEVRNLIFSSGIILYITEQTQLYANRDKGDHSFYIHDDEICRFLGFILLTGYHSLPSEVDYWSTQPDLQVTIVR